MSGPFRAEGTLVLASDGDLIAKTFRRRDAERIAADLNLADSVLASLVERGATEVVTFDLGRKATRKTPIGHGGAS